MVMTGLPGAARGKLTHSGNAWTEYMWDQDASAQTSTPILHDINTYEYVCMTGEGVINNITKYSIVFSKMKLVTAVTAIF